jgi:hypothetical protein
MKNPIIHFLKKLELEAYVEWLDFMFIVLDIILVIVLAWFVSRISKKLFVASNRV